MRMIPINPVIMPGHILDSIFFLNQIYAIIGINIGVEFNSNVASTILVFLIQITKAVKAKMPEKLLIK